MGSALRAQDGQDAWYGALWLLVPRADERAAERCWNRHCFAVAYPEDDVKKIVEELGADSILMGSDFPHPEGVAKPRDFVEEALEGLAAADIEKIMYSNGRRMLPK